MKTNTAKHAEKELNILSSLATDKNDRPIIEPFKKEILALCEAFGKSGQSGGSAPYTATALSQAIKSLLLQETIAPLTGEDSEWNETIKDNEGKQIYQNKRCSALFKDGKDGTPHYIYAIIFNGDIGGTFTGNSIILSDGTTLRSRQNIKSFPFTPKKFYIDVIDYRWEDKEETQPDINGSWWTHKIKDEKQLIEVFEYYNEFKG